MKQKMLKLFMVLGILSFSVAQAQTVSGTITDAADGTPLPGVNIVVKGTTIGVSSDFDGNYSIDVGDAANAVLQFSYIGYTSQEVPVNGRTVINVALVQSAEALTEVVVTALGITREKRSLGYSVDEVEGDAVSLAKETNVVNSLSGKVAGVVITQSASGPAGGTRVIIRGNNSLTGNNQPLYVVDGVPYDNSGVGSANGSGTANYNRSDLGTGVSDLNPDDIESISVLKGPNAAALYGSRASNGVIIITTKKGGTEQGLGVSLTSSISFQDPLLLPEYQNEYGRGRNGEFPVDLEELKASGSWGPRFDGSSQLAYNGENRPYSAQPDNVKDFFETGHNFVNTLAISKNTTDSSIRFSYSNSDIESMLPNSKVERHNFNLRGTANLTDKFSIDAKVTYFLQDAKNRPNQGTEGIMAYLYGIARNINIDDMKTYQDLDQGYGVIAPTSNGGNPYWILYEDKNEDFRRRVTGFAKAQYDFSDEIQAFIRVGTDAVTHERESYNAVGHHFYPSGRISYNTTDNVETNYDFLVMFNKDIDEDFGISANIGGNARHSTFKSNSISSSDFKIPGKYFLSNTVAENLRANQTDLIEKKVHSLYGSASVDYQDMVYLDVTARNDWSSALAADNWSYFYKSASVSALLNRLFKMEGSWVNFLKVRGSYANVGNDTGPQQIVNLFSVASNGYLGNITVSRPSIKFSESLKPEDVTSIEAGFELRALDNRLFADFTYYDIASKDLIFDVPVDPGTGYTAFRENVGEIENKGFELQVGGTPIRTDDMEWTVSANISKNKNKLVSLIEGQDTFTFSSNNAGTVSVIAKVGEGFGDIYASTWARTDDGRLLVTEEGRPLASSERTKLGNYQPDMVGGFTNNLRYKDFNLSFLIDFRIGGEVYSGTDSALDGNGVSIRSLQYREGGVTVDAVYDDGNGNFVQNTNNITAQQYWGSYAGIHGEYVYDQTNVRMREVSLSYNFPKSILEGTFIKEASASLIGRNLFFIHKESDNFDPETSYSTSNFAQGMLYYNLPTSRSLGLSVNVKF